VRLAEQGADSFVLCGEFYDSLGALFPEDGESAQGDGALRGLESMTIT